MFIPQPLCFELAIMLAILPVAYLLVSSVLSSPGNRRTDDGDQECT
jgi:hypothetical protein